MTTRRASAGAGRRLDPVLDFLRLLWSIENRLQSASKRMESSIGITGPQRLVLKVVDRFPGISAGDVAELVRLHPSTVTGILQRLVEKGLLARERDPGDHRRARLRVERRGRSHARSAEGTIEGAVKPVLASASALRLRHARALLADIDAALADEPA